MHEHPFRSDSTPLTEVQRELRKSVLKQIENEPESFLMKDWELHHYQYGGCQTTRCLCGWAEALTYGNVSNVRTSDQHENEGIRLLGLTCGEYYNGDGNRNPALFYTDDD